jgi:hypothetical protein
MCQQCQQCQHSVNLLSQIFVTIPFYIQNIIFIMGFRIGASTTTITGLIEAGILTSTKSLHDPPRLLGENPHFQWDEVVDWGAAQWLLPGTGQHYPSCGTYLTFGCLEHDPKYIKKVKYSCDRAECPICFKGWLRKAVQGTCKRIEAGKPSPRAQPIHVTLSPPKSDHKPLKFKEYYLKTRRKAIKIAKKSGLHGGCLIFHPYREIRPKKLWYWSPHFHAMGYGWINSAEIYAKHGWVVKNHRVRKSIGGTIYYQLSHAGVKRGHHVITWFGTLSWRMLKKVASTSEAELCPICGARLRPVIYRGTGDNPFGDPDQVDLYTSDLGWSYKW